MNLSHAFPAAKPKSYVGISLVVALHLAGIYALSAGLIQPTSKPPEIITLKPLPPEVDRDPPPPEPVRAPKPTVRDLPVIMVPPPIVDVAPPVEAPLVNTVVAPRDPAPLVTQPGPTQVVAQPPTGISSLPLTPGAVCSTMPRPEVPAVNWSGEAVLQVLATVRGGRVVGTAFHMAQGAPDAKTRRSLQRAVESALAGYQCQGDAVFQQDFAFRID
ncbi:MAG TPA: hypothetical protein VGF12_11865 [Roseateles sp.]|uniref:hypothetical protein n=1 Tax=Roseateles sp. TaxID=1971397 RepID=UPI002ED8C63F